MAFRHGSIDVRKQNKSLSDQTDDSAFVTYTNQPIGIATPISLNEVYSSQGGIKMRFDPVDQIKDNFRNLILTNYGERVMHADLGANIRSIQFDGNKDSFVSQARERILIAINKFMPFVVLDEISIKFGQSEYAGKFFSPNNKDIQNESRTVVIVTYSVPQLNLFKDKINIVLV